MLSTMLLSAWNWFVNSTLSSSTIGVTAVEVSVTVVDSTGAVESTGEVEVSLLEEPVLVFFLPEPLEATAFLGVLVFFLCRRHDFIINSVVISLSSF